MSDRISIRPADFAHMGDQLLDVRRRVFCQEQGVAEAIEIDGRDPHCRHVAAVDDDTGHVIGTGRMIVDSRTADGRTRGAHIGRIAVIAAYRGRGIGGRIVRFLLDDARRSGITEVHLNSQTHVAEFYERLGFARHGDEFIEADIPHIAMTLTLPPMPEHDSDSD